MGAERFEELIAWQKARVLTNSILELTERRAFAQNRVLINQLQRASISIMANIAEGFERGSAPEFHQFLVVSKASCAEVRSLLYIALDRGYIAAEEFDRLQAQSQEVARVIGGLRSSVAKQRDGQRRRPA